MTVFGLTFEFPVLLVSLELAGVITPASWLVAAMGHRAHRGGGRGGDPELRPVLDDGHGHPALRLLRTVDRGREDHRTDERRAPRGTARGADGGSGTDRRAAFEQELGFALDPFQRRAMDAIDGGESVLVSAPTGSGKTLIADYAAAAGARRRGGKAFYTTPIKALSNQKFAELARRYGEDRVGLLTGDVSHQARRPSWS